MCLLLTHKSCADFKNVMSVGYQDGQRQAGQKRFPKGAGYKLKICSIFVDVKLKGTLNRKRSIHTKLYTV